MVVGFKKCATRWLFCLVARSTGGRRNLEARAARAVQVIADTLPTTLPSMCRRWPSGSGGPTTERRCEGQARSRLVLDRLGPCKCMESHCMKDAAEALRSELLASKTERNCHLLRRCSASLCASQGWPASTTPDANRAGRWVGMPRYVRWDSEGASVQPGLKVVKELTTYGEWRLSTGVGSSDGWALEPSSWRWHQLPR